MSSQLLAGREGEGPMTIDTHTHTQTRAHTDTQAGAHAHTHACLLLALLPPLCFFPAAVRDPEGGAGPLWPRPWHLTPSSAGFPNMSFLRDALIGGVGRSADTPPCQIRSLFFFVIHPDGRDFFPFLHHLLKGTWPNFLYSC